MAAYEVLLLNTAIPQIQAAQSGDTYVVPRDIAFSAALTLSAGTANGVPYLNGSKVVTTGSALTFDGTVLAVSSLDTRLTLTSTGSGQTVGISIKGGAGSGDAFNFLESLNNDGTQAWYVGGNGVANTLAFKTNGNNERARITSTGEFQWKPNGTTQAMTLDASGNLGVGTTLQNERLRLNSSSTSQARMSISYADSTIAFFGSYSGIVGSGNATDVMLSATNVLAFGAGGTAERARITSGGNLNFGNSSADRATTAGTAVINIFNGTAPVGTLANGISLYSSSGEAYVMDAAGNATLFSPHDSETNEWIFKSKHTPSGKVLKIDVEKMLRFINDHFGLDAIHEFTEE